jgi:small subunit ribosomal protein S1
MSDEQRAARASASGDDDADSKATSAAPESLRQAFDAGAPVEGKVIGWNKGGFHVVVDGFAAFCPRSEMESEEAAEPRDYVDRSFDFKVIEIRQGGRRVVLSRAAALRQESEEQSRVARRKLEAGAVLHGTVASLTDFGAFVDLGGVQGLIHISELSRGHVGHPSDVLEVGQTVEVKVLKVEQGGRRISLSRKALEPDPWKNIGERLREGSVVTGVVEKTERFGALIEIEPGLTGLLPSSEMALPRDTSPARAFPSGREVAVQIVSIDPRRRRISLAPKGAHLGGSRSDYEDYKKAAADEMGQGFNALEAAFRKSRLQN